MELLSAKEELAYYQSFQAHPDVAPVISARLAIQDFLDSNLLTVTTSNIAWAIRELGEKLPKNIRNKPAVLVAPEPPAPEPESEQDRLRRLQQDMGSADPAVRAAAKKELKGIVRDQLVKYNK
jgi:hypothetical protein